MCIGVLKGEGSSDERDFFVAMRKGIVVIVLGSEWGGGGVQRRYGMQLSAEIQSVHLAIPRDIDSTGDTDPSKLVYEVSPMRFDVTRPVVGI